MGHHFYSTHDEDIPSLSPAFTFPPLFLTVSLRLDSFSSRLLSALPVGLWNVSVGGEGSHVPLEAIREPLWICAERTLFSGVGTEWVGSSGGFMLNAIICLGYACEPPINVKFLCNTLKHCFIYSLPLLFWVAGGNDCILENGLQRCFSSCTYKLKLLKTDAKKLVFVFLLIFIHLPYYCVWIMCILLAW